VTQRDPGMYTRGVAPCEIDGSQSASMRRNRSVAAAKREEPLGGVGPRFESPIAISDFL